MKSNGFEHIKFKGEFRDYQKRVIKNAERYLDDGKINIVAAPGSGKTVLGLELIRQIGAPCLIFSPTTAIREQWGERFCELFLEDKSQFETLFSTNLHQIKLINSITYQALYTAMDQVEVTDNNDDCYADLDIVREIRENHIGTICLDEAHHLKNEWQKSLEKLLSLIGNEVKIIALTATPPYDSESVEWKRYINMCGEVDEEIYVPELVARDNLCPHQDYIFFNYPTSDEVATLQDYRHRVSLAMEEAGALEFWDELVNHVNHEKDYDKLFSSAGDYIALLGLFRYYGFDVNKKLIRTLVGRRGLPAFEIKFAERAYRFLISGECINSEQQDALIDVFKKHSLYHKRKIELEMNEQLKRTLVSSAGKLESIAKIAENEYASMGNNLRMLVLTDYIKKEAVAKMTEEPSFNDINIVSIFETLRRLNQSFRIGVLSGSLVILPDEVALDGIQHSRSNISGTHYSMIQASGSTHDVVKAIGKLFEDGCIQILVGTKSLLGEGWDAPCINSLIMASFVGSYVLSNQMRGRAIRIDRANPDKTANIWHLVTVEPDYIFEEDKYQKAMLYLQQEKERLISYDYEVLKRRFDSFMGPNYDSGAIESGIERLTIVKPPYGKKGVERMNQEMLSRAMKRDAMREQWNGEVKDGRFVVVLESEIDKEKRVPPFIFFDVLTLLTFSILMNAMVRSFSISTQTAMTQLNIAEMAIFIVLLIPILCAITMICKKTILYFSPVRSIKMLGIAVFQTLVECGLISEAAKVEVDTDKDKIFIGVSLRNASVREQNLFNTAIAELLSPIENPRYLLIRKRRLVGYHYRYSYACPAIIGKKKENVQVLCDKLKKSTGRMESVYTRQEKGRALILHCRKKSYITKNHQMIDQRFKVKRWQ